MTGGITLTGLAAAATVAGTAFSVYSGMQNAEAQKKGMAMQAAAQKSAEASALKQEQSSQQAVNRANQKQPDTASILSAAQEDSKGGVASTMLTGPAGVDTSNLALGKSTLLGS